MCTLRSHISKIHITFDGRGNEREKRAHFPPKTIISFYPKSERER